MWCAVIEYEYDVLLLLLGIPDLVHSSHTHLIAPIMASICIVYLSGCGDRLRYTRDVLPGVLLYCTWFIPRIRYI